MKKIKVKTISKLNQKSIKAGQNEPINNETRAFGLVNCGAGGSVNQSLGTVDMQYNCIT